MNSGVRNGRFRNLEPRETAASLLGMLEARLFWTVRGGPPWDAHWMQPSDLEQLTGAACDLFSTGSCRAHPPYRSRTTRWMTVGLYAHRRDWSSDARRVFAREP